MTATEPASLDALLRAATPVEAEPFDVEFHLDILSDVFSLEAALDASREKVARHVNAERVRTEDARRYACNLEAAAARTDERIREALGYLGDALVWATDDNTRDCVSEAIAALKRDDR